MTTTICMPGRDSADIWLIPTDQPPDVVAELAALLDEHERRRAAELVKPADRRQFTVAHGAIRIVLGRCLGAAPADLTWNRGAHGKPELSGRWTGVRANLSTCGELAMLAVTQSRDVGVDLELVRPEAVALRMSARYFPRTEAEFVACGDAGSADEDQDGPAERFARLWCRKEACVKAHGGRLVEGLGLPVRTAGPLVVRDPAGTLPGTCLVRDVSAPVGYRAAVALCGDLPFTIRWRVWHGGPSRVDGDSGHAPGSRLAARSGSGSRPSSGFGSGSSPGSGLGPGSGSGLGSDPGTGPSLGSGLGAGPNSSSSPGPNPETARDPGCAPASASSSSP